ncbi:MAG: hypothetical protein ACP5NL_01750 [Thermoplasmata archaeon]
MLIESIYKGHVCRIDTDKIVKFSERTVGIGIKPSEEIWSAIKQTKRFTINNINYKVSQELDIDDETWFISRTEPRSQK